METSLEHADERDLIETFVERSRWHCRAARETFIGRISTRDDGAREYNLSVTARMLLIGESRFGVSCDFKVLAVAEMSHLTTSARELQAAMTNPLLRGLVDLLRPSVHGLASSLRLLAP